MAELRSEMVCIRFTKEELTKLDKAAKEAAISRAAYARQKILKGVLNDEKS